MAASSSGWENSMPRHLFLPLPDLIRPYKVSLAAGLAAISSNLTAFPLDSVKTRQQTHRYRSSIECIVDTYRNEGIGGFYRGILAPLSSVTFIRTASMTTYETCSKFLLEKSQPESSRHRACLLVVSSMAAGLVTSILACPFDLLKLSSQIHKMMERDSTPPVKSTNSKGGTIEVAKFIYEKGGFMKFYTGYRYHMTRELIGASLYLAGYDFFKQKTQAIFTENYKSMAIAISGALAGVLCWTTVYPIDTYKNRMQRDMYSDLLAIHLDPTKEPRQIRSFVSSLSTSMYRGMLVSNFRSALAGMTFFSCYELYNRLLE